jgi:hypothetical protein
MTHQEAIYYGGTNLQQVLTFDDKGSYPFSNEEVIKLAQIVGAMLEKANEDPEVKKVLDKPKLPDYRRLIDASGGAISLYPFLQALSSSDTCSMMAQGQIQDYLKHMRELKDLMTFYDAL